MDRYLFEDKHAFCEVLSFISKMSYIWLLIIMGSAIGTTPPALGLPPKEKIDFIRWLSRNPAVPYAYFLQQYKAVCPETSWSEKLLESCHRVVMAGAIVPNWLHEIISSGPETAVDSNAEILNRLAKKARERKSYLREKTFLLHAARNWQAFCVNPSRHFPPTEFCHPVPGKSLWQLTSDQFQNYMMSVELEQFHMLENGSPQNQEFRALFDRWDDFNLETSLLVH